MAIQNGAGVPFGDTFLVVGGGNGGTEYYDSIFEYDPAAEAWKTRGESLKIPRQQVQELTQYVSHVNKDFFPIHSLLGSGWTDWQSAMDLKIDQKLYAMLMYVLYVCQKFITRNENIT